MPQKPKVKHDDPEESQRFIDTAREVETDEDPKAFERILKKIATAKPETPKRSSD